MPPFRLNKQVFNSTLYARVRDVWFRGLPDSATTAPPDVMRKWFGLHSNEDEKRRFDALCHSEFYEALDSFGPTKYSLPPLSSWDSEQQHAELIAAPFLPDCAPEATVNANDDNQYVTNALSLILLLDQIPRNIFRQNQAVIYGHYDRIARSLLYCLLRRSTRADLHPSFRYSPAFRAWFYMPLMHSENLEDHVKYEELMRSFRDEVSKKADTAALDSIDLSMSQGKMHADIIGRFGRYPHRNEELERETTVEEKKFMNAGGSTFGTRSNA